jgi:hypothetical protein
MFSVQVSDSLFLKKHFFFINESSSHTHAMLLEKNWGLVVYPAELQGIKQNNKKSEHV